MSWRHAAAADERRAQQRKLNYSGPRFGVDDFGSDSNNTTKIELTDTGPSVEEIMAQKRAKEQARLEEIGRQTQELICQNNVDVLPQTIKTAVLEMVKEGNWYILVHKPSLGGKRIIVFRDWVEDPIREMYQMNDTWFDENRIFVNYDDNKPHIFFLSCFGNVWNIGKVVKLLTQHGCKEVKK